MIIQIFLLFSVCRRGLDIALIIDNSFSIFRNFPTYIKRIVELVNNFDVGPNKVRIGAVHFSSSAFLAFPLNKFTSKAAVAAAIKAIPGPGGQTNLADAMRKARTQLLVSPGDRKDAPNACLLFTDGIATREKNATETEANLLKPLCTLTTVSIGTDTDKSQLRRISSQNRFFETPSFDFLKLIEANLTKVLCEVPEGKN